MVHIWKNQQVMGYVLCNYLISVVYVGKMKSTLQDLVGDITIQNLDFLLNIL